MDPLNQVPAIRPVIPPLAGAERVPRVQRDEQREPARDDQHPPEREDDPEKDSPPVPPNVDRRLSYDPAGRTADERPGPHIDITA